MDAASKAHWFRLHGLTFGILLLLLGLYCFSYVPEQKEYFARRNFRFLSEMSDQIKGEIMNLATPFTNAASLITSAAGYGTNEIVGQARRQEIFEVEWQKNAERVRGALKQIRNLELISGPSLVCTGGPPEGLTIHPQMAGEDPSLELQYVSRFGSSNCPVKLEARSRLKNLFGPIVSGSELDEVLVVDAKGTVIFQRGGSELRFGSLDLPADKREKTSRTNLVSDAGMKYSLFLQPLQFQLPLSSVETDAALIKWVLCGLVRSDTLRKQSMAFSYTTLLILICIALALTLSWPFLNVGSMGPNESLRVADVFLLAFSTLLSCALLTLVLLDVCAYKALENEMDPALENLSDNILSNFDRELTGVYKQLAAFDTLNVTNWPSMTNLLANTELGISPVAHYPYYKSAVWVDASGNQVVKWTVASSETVKLNIADRTYFKNLVEGRPWKRQFGDKSAQFCLEALYSRTKGENSTVFSIPSTNPGLPVAFMETRLLSLMRPVIPAGFGFCVIENDGKVLFHSDERRNLRENFFLECGSHPLLRAAVQGRTQEMFEASYFRRVHTLLVRPVEGLPWSLVVFRGEYPLQTSNLEALTLALILYTGILVPLLGLAIVLLWRGHAAWIWPDVAKARVYLLLTAGLLAWALLFSFLVAFNREWLWVAGLSLFFPATGTGATYWALHSDRLLGWLNRFTGKRWPNHSVAYVLALTSLLVLITVVPCLGFFKLAFNSELELFVKQVQFRLDQEMELRRQRIAAEYKRITRPPDFLRQRLASRLDCYETNFFNTQITRTNSPKVKATSSAWGSFLKLVRPRFNQIAVEAMSFLSDAASDQAWQWQRAENRLIFLSNGAAGHPESTQWGSQIQTEMPTMPVSIQVLWYVAPLAIFGLCSFLIWFVAKHVFLIKVQPIPPNSLDLLESRTGHWLVLGPEPKEKTTKWPAETVLRIDWSEIKEAPGPNPLAAALPSPEQIPTVVLLNFDYRWHDARFNSQKLLCLMQLVNDPRRKVVLISSIHPLHFIVSTSGPEESAPVKVEEVLSEKRRWVELLWTFRSIYTVDRLEPSLVKNRALWETCSPAKRQILHQIATTGLINSKLRDLPRLLGRGLVKKNPKLTLGWGLSEFVRSAYQPQEVRVEESQAKYSGWQVFKKQAMWIALPLAFFFFLTQRDVWNSTIALLPAFAAAITGAVQALKLFTETKEKKGA